MVTVQLASALAHLHLRHFTAHCDLKPANILVDQAGRVRLADLGISASLDDPYTELLGMRDTRGTVTFMSPQQHEGEPPQRKG